MIPEPRSPARGRITAVIVAIAMVGGALAIRELVFDDDDGSSGGGGSTETLRVACVAELAEVCAELDANVTIANAGDTAAALIGASGRDDPDLDAWITVAPWAQIVRDQRVAAGNEPLLEDDLGPVARSPLVFVARTDRADVLAEACQGEVTWTCVGNRAGTQWSAFGGEETWGRVRPAHAEPETSAVGLLAVGQAVGDFVATDAVPVDRVTPIDWQSNDAFPGWFQQLEQSIPADAFTPGRDPFDTWLQTRGTAYDLVMTTEADARTKLADAAGAVRDSSTVLYPQPVATADVVLTPVAGGRNPSGLEDDLRDALADHGYRVDGSTAPAGAPALGDTDGLPSAGALYAIPRPLGGSRAMTAPRSRGRRRAFVAIALAFALLGAACSSGDDDKSEGAGEIADPGDCTPVDMAVSSEKIALLTDLADEFNDSDAADLGDGNCAFVRVQVKASGAAMQLLTDGWPEPESNGPQPVVWSPAASSWGAILDQRLSEKGEPAMAPPSEPFMLTPLVIAMPQPMADALGYPATPIGYADILRLANDPEGWGAYGHPEWGPFRLGKTNPNFSTSALSSTIAQYYAATGKTADLSLEDLNRPEVQQFARGVESAVVHYGDITMTFLNNWFRNDVRGTSLTYVSAVAVEEKSVIDYNKGNPDGVLSPGEEPREPARAAGRGLSQGRHALQRQPVHHFGRTVGDRRRPRRRRELRGVHQAARGPAARDGVRIPARQRRRRDRRPDQRAVGCRPEPAPDAARGAAAGGAHRAPRPLGPGSQARPGRRAPRRVRLDG